MALHPSSLDSFSPLGSPSELIVSDLVATYSFFWFFGFGSFAMVGSDGELGLTQQASAGEELGLTQQKQSSAPVTLDYAG